MKRIIDKEELRVYWQLGKWYEKTAYVIGVLTTGYLALCFIAGVLIGIASL
jgi:hypothetical protein